MSESILAKTYFVLFLRVSLKSTDSLEPHARRTLQAKAVETIDAAHHFAVALHWPPFWATTELTHLGSGGGSTHCAEGREAESRGGGGVVRGSSGNEGGRSCGRCGRETHHFRLAGVGLVVLVWRGSFASWHFSSRRVVASYRPRFVAGCRPPDFCGSKSSTDEERQHPGFDM